LFCSYHWMWADRSKRSVDLRYSLDEESCIAQRRQEHVQKLPSEGV